MKKKLNTADTKNYVKQILKKTENAINIQRSKKTAQFIIISLRIEPPEDRWLVPGVVSLIFSKN